MERTRMQVETLAWHDMKGVPEPYQVQYKKNNGIEVVKVKMLKFDKKLLPDNTIYIYYKCQLIDSPRRRINVEYDMGTGKWYIM